MSSVEYFPMPDPGNGEDRQSAEDFGETEQVEDEKEQDQEQG
jgi:hypothetical protein